MAAHRHGRRTDPARRILTMETVLPTVALEGAEALAEEHARPPGTPAHEPRTAAYRQTTTSRLSLQAPGPRLGEARPRVVARPPGRPGLLHETPAPTMHRHQARITRLPRPEHTAVHRHLARPHQLQAAGRIWLLHPEHPQLRVVCRNERTTHLHRRAMTVVRMMLRRRGWAAWQRLRGCMGVEAMGDRVMMKGRPVLDLRGCIVL